jgi:hypothetical protein
VNFFTKIDTADESSDALSHQDASSSSSSSVLRQCDEVDVSNEEQDKALALSSFDDINIVLRLNASAAALAALAQPVPAL